MPARTIASGTARVMSAPSNTTLPERAIIPLMARMVCGLAGAVGTEHHDDLARFDGELEVVEDVDLAVSGLQV